MTNNVAVQHEGRARERIVAAARQLFAERGFHQTAMADLAAVAHVSVGAIYRSFASKSDIIDAIIMADTELMLGELQGEVDKVRRGDLPAGVVIERMMFKWLSRRSDALNHEIVAESHRNPKAAETVSAICGQFREMLRDLALLLQPRLTDDEREGAAELFLACMFGMGNRQFTLPKLDDAATAKAVAKLIMQGLSIAE